MSTLSLLLCEQFPVCEPELTCLGAIVDCFMISYEESNLFIFVKKMREGYQLNFWFSQFLLLETLTPLSFFFPFRVSYCPVRADFPTMKNS